MKIVPKSLIILLFIFGCEKNNIFQDNSPVFLQEIARYQSAEQNFEQVETNTHENPNARLVLTPRITSATGSLVKTGQFKGLIYADILGNTNLYLGGSALGNGSLRFNTSLFSPVKTTSYSGVAYNVTTKCTVDAIPIRTSVRFCSNLGPCSADYPLTLIPSLYGRVYFTPEYWTTYRTLKLRLTPQPTGQDYTAKSGSVDPLYLPKTGDTWLWSNSPQHQCFVESILSETKNTVKDTKGKELYTDVKRVVRVSEINVNDNTAYQSDITVVIRVTPNSPNGFVNNQWYRSGLRTDRPIWYYRPK